MGHQDLVTKVSNKVCIIPVELMGDKDRIRVLVLIQECLFICGNATPVGSLTAFIAEDTPERPTDRCATRAAAYDPYLSLRAVAIIATKLRGPYM
jgi:hypothetical protein